MARLNVIQERIEDDHIDIQPSNDKQGEVAFLIIIAIELIVETP